MSGTAPAPTISDRLLAAWRALIREEFPRLTFLGLYEYSVQGVGLNTADLSPTDTTLPLPPMVTVPLRLPFSTATLSVGALAIVGFLNGDPARPVVLSADTIARLQIAGGAPAGLPTTAGAVARVGDTIQAGPYVGVITSGSSKVTCG